MNKIEKSNKPIFILNISFFYKLFQLFISITGIYFLWIFLHYFASHLYVKLCVPESILGFLISPLLITTPYCVGLRWIIQTGANSINNMWIVLGTWFCNFIFNLDK